MDFNCISDRLSGCIFVLSFSGICDWLSGGVFCLIVSGMFDWLSGWIFRDFQWDCRLPILWDMLVGFSIGYRVGYFGGLWLDMLTDLFIAFHIWLGFD